MSALLATDVGYPQIFSNVVTRGLFRDIFVISLNPNGTIQLAYSTDEEYELVPGACAFQFGDDWEVSYLNSDGYCTTWTSWKDALATRHLGKTAQDIRNFYGYSTCDLLLRRRVITYYNPDPPLAPDELEDEVAAAQSAADATAATI